MQRHRQFAAISKLLCGVLLCVSPYLRLPAQQWIWRALCLLETAGGMSTQVRCRGASCWFYTALVSCRQEGYGLPCPTALRKLPGRYREYSALFSSSDTKGSDSKATAAAEGKSNGLDSSAVLSANIELFVLPSSRSLTALAVLHGFADRALLS